MTRSLAALWAGACVLSGVVRAVGPDPAARPLIAVVLEDDAPATRAAVTTAIGHGGGRVVHAFDGLLLVEGPAGLARRASRWRPVRLAGDVPVPDGFARRRSEGFRLGARAWNVWRSGTAGAGSRDPRELPPPEGQDAWLPPPTDRPALSEALRLVGLAPAVGQSLTGISSPALSTLSTPYGAQPDNTSEYLAGTVSVNLILAESDGTIDASSENWSADREAQVVSAMLAGLDWIRTQEPQARLSFVYHVYPGRTDARARTGYEPIRHAADPSGSTGEALWVGQILGKLGFATGDRFVRSRAFAHATRAADGTDWAVNVFVADSLNDVDGKFGDGLFAYCWVSGPHLVLTYENGAWGVDRFDMVLRHEMLHAFYAFDEYSGSGCTCTQSRGYLDGLGANCNVCNALAKPCVMIANGDFLCSDTRRQIGWADLDGDGVVDVVGEKPDTFLDAPPAVACGPVSLSGLAAVVAPTNRNPASITPRASISVAHVAAVEARDAATGAWLAATPDDGSWGDPLERFHVALEAAPGRRTFEVHTRDDFGNVDRVASSVSVDVHPPAGALSSPLGVDPGGASTFSVGWGIATGAAVYRVYRADAPWGPWSLVGETSSTHITDDPAADAYWKVVPVDACGNEGS